MNRKPLTLRHGKPIAVIALFSVILVSVFTYVERRHEYVAVMSTTTPLSIEASDEFLSSTFHAKETEQYLSETYPQKFNAFAPGHPEATTHMFKESFDAPYRLYETGSLAASNSKNWWVSSGGLLISNGSLGSTIQGSLPEGDRIRKEYAKANPRDTDDGMHPQNIFRLVQIGTWHNYSQQAYFRITKLNISESENRNESNGLLLFNRYQSGDNLYYAGVRVDGDAVIKKKINGIYYTLAEQNVFPGDEYDRDTNPSNLPINTWIGLKSVVTEDASGGVVLRLYMDKNWTEHWTLVLEAVDTGTRFGGPAITSSGYAGIRTDFMDVEFNEYKIEEI